MMGTLIFRTIAPLVTVVMVVFSIFILLRGHDAPGGGFIGGLIAAASIAIYGMAMSTGAARHALHADPLAYAGFGVLLAAASGFASLAFGVPYLTGLWLDIPLGDTALKLSTPLLFDIGVYFAVFGTVTAAALALEDGEAKD